MSLFYCLLSLKQQSEHPLAEARVSYLKEQAVAPAKPCTTENITSFEIPLRKVAPVLNTIIGAANWQFDSQGFTDPYALRKGNPKKAKFN